MAAGSSRGEARTEDRPGLRERKRRRTYAAVHDAAMRLFAERGYGAVTVSEIAAAAEVSRATVFAYYPAKEDIVLGDIPLVLERLAAALRGAGDADAVIAAVRGWSRTLVGWVEPELVLQLRLADEVPAVAAARSRLLREIEVLIAAALESTMAVEARLAPQLVARSLTTALQAFEREAALRIASGGRPLPPAELDGLLDEAVAFVEGGLRAVRTQQLQTK